MVFPRGDGSFSGIAMVEMRQDELEVDMLAMHVLFEFSWGFVVQALEDGV
jgi:hypothetical protein